MAIKLLLLFLIFFAIIPNLGFFTVPSIFVLFFVMCVFGTIILNPNILQKSDKQIKIKNLPLIFFLLLFFSALYYGGLYQNQDTFLTGYLIFFIILFYVFNCFFTKKKVSLQIVIIGYIVLSLWTLISSPHPIVDTFVVLKEAPLKFISGINPYASSYSQVYPHIIPNYYNYLPFSFIFILPFVVFFSDPRYSIIFVNVMAPR